MHCPALKQTPTHYLHMKTISAALFFALVGTAAAAESCPDELPGKVELNGAGLAFHYGILENDQALCGKLVSDTEAWIGFAAQPEGKRQVRSQMIYHSLWIVL